MFVIIYTYISKVKFSNLVSSWFNFNYHIHDTKHKLDMLKGLLKKEITRTESDIYII